MAIPPHGTLITLSDASVVLEQSKIHGAASGRVLQGLCINQTTKELYVTQLRGSTGDLTLTRLKSGMSGYTIADHMVLTGFGHGVALGVQNAAGAGGSDRIWIECNAAADANGNYFGTQIGHFPYRPNMTPTLDTSAVGYPFTPVAGATNFSCVAQGDTNCLLVRYESPEGTGHYQGFNLTDAETGVVSAPYLTTARLEPSGIDANTFQGWTFIGQYAYTIDGVPNGDVYITSIDLNAAYNDSWIERVKITADSTASRREPEGITWMASGNALLFTLSNYVPADTYHASDLLNLSDS